MAASTATVGSVSLVFLIAAAANGCADYSFAGVGRQVPRPELGVQAEPRTSSRSDRLRGSLAQASPPPQVPERTGPTADKPTPARPTADPPRQRARLNRPVRKTGRNLNRQRGLRKTCHPKAGTSLTRGPSSTGC
jgi:hypothetical protein